MNTPTQHQASREAMNIVTWLRNAADDRSTMAELRCLLNPNLRHRGWKAISTIGGIGSFPAELLAGLFALHPLHSDRHRNLGTSCKALAAKRKTSTDAKTSPLDIYFRRILDADRSELADVLQKLFRNFKSESIPVNYTLLYDDLKYWGDSVHQRWAKEYWNTTREDEDDSAVSE